MAEADGQMKCSYCDKRVKFRDLVAAGPLFVGPYFQVGHAHRICKDEAIGRYRNREASKKEERVKEAAESRCPFRCGSYVTGKCLPADCMAWSGTDCRRLT